MIQGSDRVLALAVGVSILLHGALLSVKFKFPDASPSKPELQRLEVVLVNARTRERPSRPQVLAQANLDRGGNVDDDRRARTPLPVTAPRKPGKDVVDARRRVRELEEQQQRLLAQARESALRAAPELPHAGPAEQSATQPSGQDLADLALATMRLEAEINRNIREYQKRPRKKFIGASAAEYRFAQYEDDWRGKIERIGTLNYPPEARGKFYGNLRLTVTLRADGGVESIELDRSSGLKVLDAAAFKIVRMASPFAQFPPSIRKDFDQLVITRTWFFGQGDKIWTE
ncbi:MAG TPA: TonB family protein [Burkholderiales bacterium]|nr:TonB family protein [Burkholderiales bacterium]